MTPNSKVALELHPTVGIIGGMKTLFTHFCSNVLVFFSLCLICLSARANQNPVTFSGKPIPYSVGGNNLQIWPEARVNLPNGETLKLSLSGKGTRQKFLAFVKVNAYVAIHYLDNPNLLDPQEPIGSLDKARARLMILQMLQDVNPEDIRAEFDDGLDVNHVDLYSPEITALREQTTYSLDAGQKVYIIGYSNGSDGKEHILVYNDEKSIKEQGSTLVTDIWKVWLGIPVDPEMAALKKSLLNSVSK